MNTTKTLKDYRSGKELTCELYIIITSTYTVDPIEIWIDPDTGVLYRDYVDWFSPVKKEHERLYYQYIIDHLDENTIPHIINGFEFKDWRIALNGNN